MVETTAVGFASQMPQLTQMTVTVVVCQAPRRVSEHLLQLQTGATIADALMAVLGASGYAHAAHELLCGIWGRQLPLQHPLSAGDRIEVYRPLLVDPKLARRQRFKRQGARAAGLFAAKRPGAKSGY